MAIPESQLETWANQGAITTAKATADSVKNALNSYSDWPNGVDFEVYLQGSYKNDANIRGDSDVDVVAQLNSTFYSNLSEDQKRILGLTPATYHLSDFRADVLKILKNKVLALFILKIINILMEFGPKIIFNMEYCIH